MITEFPQKYFHSSSDTGKITPTPLAFFRQPLLSFILNLPAQARILDAGCGGGKVSQLVKTHRPDVKIYANDISEVGQYLPVGVEFKKVSVESLDQAYPPDFFDAIICLHVIEHLLYPMRMILAIRSVLKPGGQLFIETPNWTRLFIPFSPGQFFWNDYTHIRPFSTFSLRKLLEEHEFSAVMTRALISTTLAVNFSVKPTKSYAPPRQGLLVFMGKIIRRLILRFVPDILIATATK